MAEDLTSLSDRRPLSVQLKYMKNKEERRRNPDLLPKSTRFKMKKYRDVQERIGK